MQGSILLGVSFRWQAPPFLSPNTAYRPSISRPYEENIPYHPDGHQRLARVVGTGAIAEIPDVQADPDDEHRDDARTFNFRNLRRSPCSRTATELGAIAIARTQTGEFPATYTELLRTFADQAVIAIENVRLFEAEQQRTRELSGIIGAADCDLGGATGNQVARLEHWNRYSRPCWRMRRASAGQTSAPCTYEKGRVFRVVHARGDAGLLEGPIGPVAPSRTRNGAWPRRADQAGGAYCRRYHRASVS